MKILPLTTVGINKLSNRKTAANPAFKGDKSDDDSDLFDLYLHDIKKYKRINRAKERELAKKIKAGGEIAQNARNELLNANLRLVVDRAQIRKKHSPMPIMDLIQEGNMGAYKATEKYNGDYAFSTYATPWIDVYMRNAEYLKYSFIKLPANTGAYLKQITDAEEQMLKEGVKITIKEISKRTHFSPNRIKALLNFVNGIKSLNEKIGESDSASDEYQDLLADSKAESPAAVLDKKILESDIRRILSRLNDARREQIILYYGLFGNPELTQKEIGKMYNSSYQAVQNRLRKSMEQLQQTSSLQKYKSIKEFLENT